MIVASLLKVRLNGAVYLARPGFKGQNLDCLQYGWQLCRKFRRTLLFRPGAKFRRCDERVQTLASPFLMCWKTLPWDCQLDRIRHSFLGLFRGMHKHLLNQPNANGRRSSNA